MHVSRDRPPERTPGLTLPSGLVRAALQVEVLRSACAQLGPFSAGDLSGPVGITATRVSHALRLPRGTGLIEAAPGRLHRATATGRQVAQRWSQGSDEGHAALRDAWETTWFVQTARSRAQAGPVTAQAMAEHLFAEAHAGAHGRLEVEVLIDILAHIGLLQTPRPGLLGVRPRAPLPVTKSRRNHHQPAAPLPEPRRSGEDWAEVEELLTNPIHAADLIRLAPDDLEHVQQHLRRLAAIIVTARHRPPTDDPTI